MPAPTMLIWRKKGPANLCDVQEPTGAMQFGLTLSQVRKLALDNRWAVEYPDTPGPTPG